jgi:hypothetical protein
MWAVSIWLRMTSHCVDHKGSVPGSNTFSSHPCAQRNELRVRFVRSPASSAEAETSWIHAYICMAWGQLYFIYCRQ